jgi:23S rRNA (adenine2503-C2)-methyltransferase
MTPSNKNTSTEITPTKQETGNSITSKSLKDIRKMTEAEIKLALANSGEKPFRAKQIYEWLWQKSAQSFDDMTNLSKEFRNWLKENFLFRPLVIATQQRSNDGTVKVAFRLHDNHLVEGVLIPAEDRMTACISSQVGCSLTCKFCATGYMDRIRNLDAGEIYDQVVLINKIAQAYYQLNLSNIVYMGMGEPMLNYANVLQSVEHLTSESGLNMSPKRITVSTAGVAKMIRKLGDDGVKFNLALSLHAANDLKRNQIMPINESNTLDSLRDALKYYFQKTKNKVTYEYIVFNNFNDTQKDAEELYQFTKHLPAKVNVIEYNPIAEANFVNTDEKTLDKFCKYLENKGVNVHLRRSRGKDIDAACGQLAIKDRK